MILTQRDLSSIAACVDVCNDDGVFDDLIDKLRALHKHVGQGGLALPDLPKRGRTSTITAMPPPSRWADFDLEHEAGAPDAEVADDTAVEDLARPGARASTVAAVAQGVERAERENLVEEPQRRRMRRTKTQIDLPTTEGKKP